MTPEETFKLCNAVALFSWIVLVIFPNQRWVHRIIVGVIITSLCVLYAYIILKSIGGTGDSGSFSTLEGVMQLFTKKEAVLAGWIHYLAFDLMTGLYIVNNAKKYMINHLVLLPCLFFTFMLGPIGLLLYLVIRGISNRQYFHDYV